MDSFCFQDIDSFLIDLDGVVYIEDELIDGAREAIQRLVDRNIPFRFMTNTTVKSLRNLLFKLERLGVPACKEWIISPPAAARRYLSQFDHPKCHLVVHEDTVEDFAGLTITDENPDFVIVGKIGKRWTYDLMNRIFLYMMDGADLIALHKDRYTMGDDRLYIEFGAFVAGLEYAASKEAIVIGKPSKNFYQTAIDSLGCCPERIAMLGDDLISDIQGRSGRGSKECW